MLSEQSKQITRIFALILIFSIAGSLHLANNRIQELQDKIKKLESEKTVINNVDSNKQK